MTNKGAYLFGKFIFVIIPIVTIIGICARLMQKQETQQSLDEFSKYFAWVDSNEVTGRLSYVRTGTGKLEVFKLEGDPERTYYARLLFKGNVESFPSFAKAGDSIIRHKFSDKMILVKHGKEYVYTWIRY